MLCLDDESVPSAGRVRETQMMREEESERGDPIGPLDWRRILPFAPAAASDRRGWVGLEAARCRAEPAFERHVPALTHHRLVLVARPPEALELRYDGVQRHVPPPAGSITLVPAGSPVWAHSSGHKDELHIFLEAGVVARVAAEAFDLDPARVSVSPLDGLDLPHLRAAMGAVAAELTASAPGGRLAAESLANILAVQLIRQVLAPRRSERGRDGALPQGTLRAVVAYIEDHLDAVLTLDQMAAAAHLSAYHFARQFKAATGVPPHQYVIARRVERAQQLLHPDRDLPLAEIAARVGFSDQSQFSHHFTRVVGVTPRQFRLSARIA
jgi:AraC family transcriptional regulator